MTDISDSGEESYSYTSSKVFYKRSRSKPSSPTSAKVYTVSADVDDTSEYLPVSKWAVDYNNRNYIRSMCNKNKGLHRSLKGRPPKFKIHYDNNYFIRSKVNEPKGIHRTIPEIKRKYVPDDDDLADATGWEFDYGPEFDQEEQDVCYIPEGRITRRGCYRSYGVKRNDFDCDVKMKEERENLLNEELEQELKYGQEFPQSDIPYLAEEKNKRYTRGGYRFYEVPRNVHDFKPEELVEIPRDPEWRRKYHCDGARYLDLEMCQCDSGDMTGHHHQAKKGKPFRRTILNKVYELKKEDSSKDVKRHATRLSLIPGEGRQSLYEGIPDRERYGTEETKSVRSPYKMNKVRYSRRLFDEDLTRKDNESRRFDDYTYKVKPEGTVKQKKQGKNGSAADDRENFETWKENTLYEKEENNRGHRIMKNKSSEVFYEKRSYPSKDGAAERRDREEYYEHEEHRSQRGMSRSQDYRHGNQIYKQIEGNKIKGKTRDRNDINIHLPHIKDRGKVLKDADNFEAKLTPEKGGALNKMPSHVEERIKNIRGRMEREMEPGDRKYKGPRKSGGFDHSSSDEGIDFMKHKHHPQDRGEEHKSGYEKYITKNGSEIWVKENEKYAELHHKNPR